MVDTLLDLENGIGQHLYTPARLQNIWLSLSSIVFTFSSTQRLVLLGNSRVCGSRGGPQHFGESMLSSRPFSLIEVFAVISASH